jgi:hypothetical protein
VDGHRFLGLELRHECLSGLDGVADLHDSKLLPATCPRLRLS